MAEQHCPFEHLTRYSSFSSLARYKPELSKQQLRWVRAHRIFLKNLNSSQWSSGSKKTLSVLINLLHYSGMEQPRMSVQIQRPAWGKPAELPGLTSFLWAWWWSAIAKQCPYPFYHMHAQHICLFSPCSKTKCEQGVAWEESFPGRLPNCQACSQELQEGPEVSVLPAVPPLLLSSEHTGGTWK